MTDLANGVGEAAVRAVSNTPGAAPFSTGRLTKPARGGRSRRQIPWVVAGVLLVAGSALGFAIWADMQSERTRVLVASTDIALGQVIDPQDLREAAIAVDGAMEFVSTQRLAEVVGQTAQSTIPAGTVLVSAHVGDEHGVPDGMAVVGAALNAGAFPVTDLAIGDRVDLYEVASSRQDASTEVLLGVGEVWSVERIELGGEPRIFLSLLVDAAISGAATNAVARDLLHVVLVSGAS